MSIKPRSPQSIGQVLDTSFKLFRMTWLKVWPFALVGALAGYAGDGYQLFVAAEDDPKALAVILTIVGAFASIAFYGAIYLRQDAVAGGQPAGDELNVAFRRLPRLILMSLALFLVIGASAIPMGAFIGVSMSQGWPIWVTVVGSAVLCLPPVVLLVNMVFGTVVLLLEDRRAVESLKVSARLVRGNWWRTFAVLSVGGVILLVAYSLVGIAAAVAAPILSGQEATVTVVFAALLALILVGLIVTPYFIALMLALYYDLKLRKEGGDLAARIDNLT